MELKEDAFNRSLREWRRQETLFREACTIGNPFSRPSCSLNPHCIHLDGNAKLYRYRSSGSVSAGASLYADMFMVDGEEVEEAVARVQTKKMHLADNNCGNWKAAKTNGKRYGKVTQTGVMLATCRHMFLLKGLDMLRGEIYSYPYILQMKFPGANFIAMDTICRYWPWLQKLDARLAQTQKPFLSVMHAKAHNWQCQLTWGGRNQLGSGLSTGETTELANSYISRLGLVTRYMTAAGRQERIVEAASFWNIRKLIELPRLLQDQLHKAEASLKESQKELPILLEKLSLSEDAVKELCFGFTRMSQDHNSLESRIEFHACNVQRLSSQILSLSDSSKGRARLRAKLSEAHKALNKLIGSYCQGSDAVSADVLKQCCKTMIFPWTMQEDNAGSVHFRPELLKAFEFLNLRDRSLEELAITAREQEQFLKYIADAQADLAQNQSMNALLRNRRQRFLSLLVDGSLLLAPCKDLVLQSEDESHLDILEAPVPYSECSDIEEWDSDDWGSDWTEEDPN